MGQIGPVPNPQQAETWLCKATGSRGWGQGGRQCRGPIPAKQLSPSQISGEQARRKSRVSEERSAPHSSAGSGEQAKHLPAACSCSQICYDLSRPQEGKSASLESKRGCGVPGGRGEVGPAGGGILVRSLHGAGLLVAQRDALCLFSPSVPALSGLGAASSFDIP